MKNKIYVIVHEWCIGHGGPKYKLRDIATVKLNLGLIKLFNDYVKVDNWPSETHPNMPPPSDQLEVLVCGAYKQACVQSQINALQKKGYNAQAYEPACLPGLE